MIITSSFLDTFHVHFISIQDLLSSSFTCYPSVLLFPHKKEIYKTIFESRTMDELKTSLSNIWSSWATIAATKTNQETESKSKAEMRDNKLLCTLSCILLVTNYYCTQQEQQLIQRTYFTPHDDDHHVVLTNELGRKCGIFWEKEMPRCESSFVISHPWIIQDYNTSWMIVNPLNIAMKRWCSRSQEDVITIRLPFPSDLVIWLIFISSLKLFHPLLYSSFQTCIPCDLTQSSDSQFCI